MDVTAPGTLTAAALAEAVRAIDATVVFASPAALAVTWSRDAPTDRSARRWPASGCCSRPGAPVRRELLEAAVAT